MPKLKQPQPAVNSKDLAAEKAKTEALFDSIGEAVIATNEQGEIMRINDATTELLGYTSADLLSKNYLSTVHAFDLDGAAIPPLMRPVMRSLIEGKPVTDKLQYLKKDGSLVPVVATVSPIMLSGKPIGTIQVFRDITREQEIDKAKTEFLSLASHQLRTPATAVKQYVGILREGFVGELSADQKRAVEQAYQSNERQLKIIEDLLRVAKVDSGKMSLHRTQTNLNQLLENVMTDQAASIAKRNQTIEFKHRNVTCGAMVDAHLIRTVFENLIDNASKYSPKGARIVIDIRKSSSQVSIAICDEGVGIPRSDMPMLFQKFKRLPNPLSLESNGTGLGLYWVKKVLDYHDGQITVRSKTGSGSTFTVILPLR